MISRASYSPSGYGVVSRPVQAYGAVVSVQTSVQVEPPDCRNWPVTEATPLPAPSSALSEMSTVPRSGVSAGTEPVGALLSTTRVSAESATLPAASVARARSSYEPSISSDVLSAHERGDVVPEQAVVQLPPAGR